MCDDLKNVDVEEVKENIINQIEEIKEELSDLDFVLEYFSGPSYDWVCVKQFKKTSTSVGVFCIDNILNFIYNFL